MSEHFDLVIIGSGSAAREAALRAREYGKTVAMAERGLWGGSCPNVACAPTKAYVAAAELLHDVRTIGAAMGLATPAPRVDLARVKARKDALTRTQEGWLDFLHGKGIATYAGEAAFIAPREVSVGGEALEADNVLVATGSRTAVPPIPGIDGVEWLDHVSILQLEDLPASMLVVGAGPVGLELGQAFARFGTRVTVVDVVDRIAPRADADASAELAAALDDEGIELLLPATIDSVAPSDVGVTAAIGGDDRRFERMLLAAGRAPNVEGLGLDRVGVETNRAGIVVEELMRTSVPGIWAAGDVTGRPQLSPLADFMGRVAADDMFGVVEPPDFSLIPTAIFTDPEVAGVGLTEAEAVEQGFDVATATYPLAILQRAFYVDATHGIFKLVYERESRRVRGIHVASRGAADIVQGYTVALAHGITVDELADAHNIFPAFGEGIKYAAQQATAVASPTR